jgi:SAM-dependent methyltransferase
MSIQLDEVIPWGRSFDEYRRMFSLSERDLGGRILGCADGPASFNAEATALGHRVVSCDPIYAFTAPEIEKRVQDWCADMIAKVWKHLDGFVWTDFRDPDHLGACRIAAMRRFLADFDRGRREGRYLVASLPELPLAPDSFDLALVSHFLFLYSDHLDFAFHEAAVLELLRVAKEVRIFPLLTLERKRSPHLEPLRYELKNRGIHSEIVRVPYEFQRGGNEMLRISENPRMKYL